MKQTDLLAWRRSPQGRRALAGTLVVLNVMLSLGIGMNAYITAQAGMDGTIISTGGRGTARVHVDPDGVPRIVASTPEALFFAQGYVQGRDALFLADVARRIGSGTLAALLGDSQVEHDVLMRKIDIPRMARAAVARTSQASLRMCQAYIDGINAHLASTRRTLPVEYDILKVTGLPVQHVPDPFTVEDIMHVLLYFSFEFSSNLGFNVGLRDFISAIGIEAFDTFKRYLKIGDEYTVSHDALEAAFGSRGVVPDKDLTISRAINRSSMPLLLGESKGSNAWVVSGSRTASGRAMLATDPHMKVSTPGLLKSWHLACESTGLVLTGAQFPLVPGILMGRNARVAWGMTAPFLDAGDAWIETTSDDGMMYLYNGTYHPVDEDTIQVHSSSGTIHERTITRVPGHGVLLDIDGNIVSFRWSAMIDERPVNNGSNLLDALFRLFDAGNVADMIALADPETGWDDFPLHVLFATSDGDIGFIETGRLPLRGNVTSQGAIPVVGRDPANDWIRFTNATEIRHVVNPPSGFLHAANSKIDITSAGSPPAYQAPGWGNAYRHARIRDMLDDATALTVVDMQAVQGDLLDQWAPVMVPAIMAILDDGTPRGEPAGTALQHWASWDHRYARDSTGATVHATFLKHYGYAILGDELRLSWDGNATSNLHRVFKHVVHPEILLNLTVDYHDSAAVRGLFNDVRTGEVETIKTIVERAFNETVIELGSRLGDDAHRWEWSHYNTFELVHPFNANEQVLGFLNLGPYLVDGGHCVRMQRGSEGAATRVIVEWTTTPTTSVVTPPGPRGNPFSPFKDSEMSLYLTNGLKLYTGDASTLPVAITFT